MSKPIKQKHKIYQIEWDDSRQPKSTWQWLSDANETGVAKCVSVGFLIRNDKKVKSLAPNIADLVDEDAQVTGVIHIPAACVTRMIKLKAN